MGKLIIYYNRQLKTIQSVLSCLKLGSKVHYPQFSEIFASFKSLAKETSDNLNKGVLLLLLLPFLKASLFKKTLRSKVKTGTAGEDVSLLGLHRSGTGKELSASYPEGKAHV